MTRRSQSKKNPVTVRGPWVPMPLDFLASRACASLSLHAAKLLLDLVSQLGPNARGNGDLSAAAAVLKPRGWRGNATIRAALRELHDAGLVSISRQGGRHKCSLYAVTLWPQSCDSSKLDHGPGSFSTIDWMSARKDAEKRPTKEDPARWNAARSGEVRTPATGAKVAPLNPPRVQSQSDDASYAPATGAVGSISANSLHPPRVPYLDMPSARASDTRMGKLLRRARPATRPPAYATARPRLGRAA